MSDSKNSATNPSTGVEELLHITSPASWAALLGLLTLVCAALGWSYFGRLPVDVSGRGVLLPKGGLTRAQTPVNGLITGFAAQENDRVKKGDVLATVASSQGLEVGQSVNVLSPTEGVVLQHLVDVGNFVEAGTALALIGDGADDELEAWVFVPFEQAGAIDEGMPVFLTLETVAPEENGYLEGSVTSVGEFPITEERLADTFGNDPRWIAYLLAGEEPRALVRVSLKRASGQAGGYAWTMGRGPATKLSNGMVCNGAIRVSYARPMQAAVPKRSGKKS